MAAKKRKLTKTQQIAELKRRLGALRRMTTESAKDSAELLAGSKALVVAMKTQIDAQRGDLLCEAQLHRVRQIVAAICVDYAGRCPVEMIRELQSAAYFGQTKHRIAPSTLRSSISQADAIEKALKAVVNG